MSGSAEGSASADMPSRASKSQHQRNEPPNQRYSNLIYDSEVFLTKLREFKPQSLGCLEARRKSSSTLIFPNPQQACMGSPKCSRYPHDIKPTLGYWIECHGPGVTGARSGSQVPSGEQHAIGINVRASGSDEMGTEASEYLFRAPSTSVGGKIAPDELKLVVESASGRSSGSLLSHHIPTTPTAERILTRHDKDILSNQDELDELMRHDFLKRLHSIDSPADIDAAHAHHQPPSEHSVSPASNNQGAISAAAIGRAQPTNASSSPDMAYIQDKSMGQGKQRCQPGETPTKNVSEIRKRLNKRTMTRDDIDLHKPRRGTPNITITEPSFNQSTITYQPNLLRDQRQRAIRQESLSKGINRLESVDSSEPPELPKYQVTQSGSTSNELGRQLSIEEPSGIIRGEEVSILRRQESSESEEQPIFDMGVLDFRPYRQHRPSVIREDSDVEGEGSSLAPEQRYCGLSTTNFQKKPYQQAYQQSQNITQFKDGSLELISFEEENYEKHYYGREHWNYFTNDELLGPVMLSLKQEVNNARDHFHVLLRTVSYTLHGTIPASTICADRYDREAIVRELSEIAKLKPPLMLGQLPSTPDDLLKLDHIFIKTELKVGVIYIKAGQAESEEAILGNKEESPLFTEFLDLLGDRITLKGFDRYKGGLDTVHNLTGTESVYTMWRNIEIMFHVSTMLPHEENDPQKLQKKRHIGNDIVCVAFIESDDTLFWPGCIKSYFLHTFITIQTSPRPLKEGEKRKYSVSCVCRNEVQYAFKPYLVEQDEFFKSDYFREWLLVKIVNGERASYSAPKFARMQDRTRSQLLEDIITNLANHLVTGQIPKPYRRGSWRPLGHARASSPLEDSMKDYFEDYDQLAKDFNTAFCGPSRSILCDVIFRVKDKNGNYKLVHGVRAIMAIRSRTFLEMLYGFVPLGTGPSNSFNQTSLRAIEMKALSGECSGAGGGKDSEPTKTPLTKRGSVGADSGRKTAGEKERRQSMLPNLSKSVAQKPTYLTVPNTGGGGGGGSGAGGSGGTGGMIKNAFNRLVSGNWSGWSGNIKGYKGEPMHIKVDQNKTKVDLNSLAICKEIAKIDPDKLTQREFEIKEFDYETFQQAIEYIHNGQCKLSYETIPGLICAAEHYDLPDLLHACFHHANTHMKLSAAPKMMNALFENSCFYVTAMQLLDSIYEYIDPHGMEFFSTPESYELKESVFTTLLARKTLQISELKKFQAMHGWAKNQIMIKQHQKQLQLQRQQSLEQQQHQQQERLEMEEQVVMINSEEAETEYKNLMIRLNKEVNIKLDRISNEDLVKIVLPTKVFSNDRIFDIMADESRCDY